MNLDKFHVVTIVSNPIRFASRYKLFKLFEEDIQRKGGQLWTVEMQTGARLHKITESTNPRHLQIWTTSISGELWHKENLLNIAVQHLTAKCPDWRYVAWIDADVKFEPGAIEETAHALQHFDVVQMWSHAIDLGPNDELVNSQMSYMYCYWNNLEPRSKDGYTRGGHPGYAWAIRRDALNKLGGFIDFAALGSADRHQAAALLGRVDSSVHGDMHPTYRRWLNVWQDRAVKELKHNVGYVPGTIRHLWHGKKADRGYSSRWKILVEHQFNPETDLKKDVSGLWQLVVDTPRQIRLRDDMRRYFRARREDSIDTY